MRDYQREVERLREENERLGEEPAWAHTELMRLRRLLSEAQDQWHEALATLDICAEEKAALREDRDRLREDAEKWRNTVAAAKETEAWAEVERLREENQQLRDKIIRLEMAREWEK